MFYVLYGEDDFSLHKAMEGIKNGLGDLDMLAVNTSSLDGRHLSLGELKDSCSALPFLSPHRLVIVNGLLERFEPKRGKSGTGRLSPTKAENGLGAWQGLASHVKQMAPSTVLVLIDGKLSSRNPLLKKLTPLAEVRYFPLLWGKKLKAWTQQQVNEGGGNITLEAINLLTEFIGGNLWAMNNEVAKLLLYVRGRAIGEDDVRQIVGDIQEANIFALVDAILEGRVGMAQRILHQLYGEGASSGYILTMITRQFRLVVQVRESGAKLSRQEIQRKIGLVSSYALDKTLSQAKLYNFEQVREAYGKLLESDLAIKTGKCDDKLALELLVTELSSSQV